MDATARLVVALDGRCRSVPTTLFAEAPLLIRVTAQDRADGSGLHVHLVGGAAGPLGGDRLRTSVEVHHGSRLVVRSVAASLAQPGRAGSSGSCAEVAATVAPGASLDWWPEPLVSVAGSDHTQTTSVDIADASARVRWVDEIVLGRHLEAGGRLTVRQRFSIGALPVLRHTVTFDPATAGIGRHGTGRVAVTALVVGPPALATASTVGPGLRVVRYPLSAVCTAWIALADDLDRARRALSELALGAIDEVETSA